MANINTRTLDDSPVFFNLGGGRRQVGGKDDVPVFFKRRDSVQKQYFKMRGVDSGTSTYTSWTVDRVPDFTGALATVANTSPALSGSITANSTIISAQWRALP